MSTRIMSHSMKSRVKKLSFLLWACLWLCRPVTAGLAGRIAGVVGKAKPAEYAVHVVEPDSGAVIYSHNATTAMTPASNMKLVTTAAALRYLGPLFEYRTRIGLCDGALVVIGSGDPLLGDPAMDALYGRPNGWVFDEVVCGLEQLGVESVADIVIDTTVFDDQRVHPNWLESDLNRWYACEVCGLNYRGNCIQVTTTNQGGRIGVQVEPSTSFVEIANEIQAVSSGATGVGAYRTRQPNRIILRGKCKDKEGPFDVAIEQPGAFFGFLLAEHLVRAGIPVGGHLVERPLDPNGRLIPVAEYATPLIDCLHRANKDSLGLAAEALLKTIAAHENPDRRNGSWEKGRERIGDYLTGLGIPRAEFEIDDGSGLSRKNLLSARAIVAVLRDAYTGGNWELYRTSLAVGGADGTIGRYFKESAYRAGILGKTGYISGVRSFSGICLTDERPYLFSIISNRSSLSRDAINAIAQAIMDEYRRKK
ncbi:MAG: D-alanyl-D-alanine carboxypeptidase/D-alanyl-D-alanine-endopeptidase [Sedimentisphaerales bacterium]|nr:D-alanyl-D-alanine carboxypeptidase/D-alanyl-D-alanine-endopeptidase [Sedimentisphaerales bacterium]HNY79207.1 D-alanyl-D-alanine carboxypeptidase/D-alanyl-D-alanine-endopeptidase [Sedimentisphaerales bacterium]HOC61495.1 D-alanyl-D-alanine carboxypeptidase/D-alanyl-D-alanine-endopeptidase [Sedimentisphaerales bacterium]HOH65241.1 D-alanyl-D-alanine carboxypeptidase/D-alanyl-D-alanine-endopeptidase [Sedimentisphaerales bacterium]HPY51826.1 D-alanyl-D-alanine carboxypeptidase/D-alanyl-D-alani